MNEEYFNTPEYKAKKEQWFKELEEEEAAKAKAAEEAAKAKRQDYLSKAGPFDPYTFMEVAGWNKGKSYKQVFKPHPSHKDLSYTIADGEIFDKPGFLYVETSSKLRADYEKGLAKQEFFPVPKSLDEFYGILEKFGMLKPSATEKADLERKYVITKITRQ